jgi:CHASE2 domain-containing sensor protein
MFSRDSRSGPLRNKLVLIGQGSDAARDRDLSPLFRVRQSDGKREQIAGTELHAAAIATLLDGNAIGEVPVWIQGCVNFILLAAATWVFTRLRLRMAFALAAVFIPAIYASAQVLFTRCFICGSPIWKQFSAWPRHCHAAWPGNT